MCHPSSWVKDVHHHQAWLFLISEWIWWTLPLCCVANKRAKWVNMPWRNQSWEMVKSPGEVSVQLEKREDLNVMRCQKFGMRWLATWTRFPFITSKNSSWSHMKPLINGCLTLKMCRIILKHFQGVGLCHEVATFGTVPLFQVFVFSVSWFFYGNSLSWLPFTVIFHSRRQITTECNVWNRVKILFLFLKFSCPDLYPQSSLHKN